MSQDQLKVYTDQFAAWDPAMIYHKDYWYVFSLATENKVTAEDFFVKSNHMQGFRSLDCKTWENIGRVVDEPPVPQNICAGSAISVNGKIYLFYSKNIDIISENHLDQRIFLSVSDDGFKYYPVESFSMEPDSKLYTTNCFHPNTKKMLFAWRDPYVFQDPFSERFYIYACAGGFRWGVPPTIAVAYCDKVDGKFRVLPPAIKTDEYKEKWQMAPLTEIERPFLRYENGQYILYCSCWLRHVSDQLKAIAKEKEIYLTDSTIYRFRSTDLAGPFTFCWDDPVLAGSSSTGLYGGLLVESENNSPFLVGWYPNGVFNLEVSNSITYSLKHGLGVSPREQVQCI